MVWKMENWGVMRVEALCIGSECARVMIGVGSFMRIINSLVPCVSVFRITVPQCNVTTAIITMMPPEVVVRGIFSFSSLSKSSLGYQPV